MELMEARVGVGVIESGTHLDSLIGFTPVRSRPSLHLPKDKLRS
jgi:hypothetical protein